ncbi:MAG: ABC transporter substrate-binding protein, partial [Rubrivivax sp.]
MKRRTLSALAATLALGCSLPALAQSPLATYEGPDRMERIVAAAKKEGSLTLYTTIAEKDLPTLLKPFEA